VLSSVAGVRVFRFPSAAGGRHLDGEPRFLATDGGIIDAGDGGEVLDDDESTDDGRPDDCDCGDWNDGEGLPCWPCYRDGFEEPASTGDE